MQALSTGKSEVCNMTQFGQCGATALVLCGERRRKMQATKSSVEGLLPSAWPIELIFGAEGSTVCRMSKDRRRHRIRVGR